MRFVIPILAIIIIALITGCASNTPNNTPAVNSSVAENSNNNNNNVTATSPASTSDIGAYADTSMIDQGIDEVKQVD